jgi:hypothetical protein
LLERTVAKRAAMAHPSRRRRCAGDRIAAGRPAQAPR